MRKVYELPENEPIVGTEMCKGQLFVATTRSVYVMQGQKLYAVPFMREEEEKDEGTT